MTKDLDLPESILKGQQALILFDGVCSLCNHSVDFIIRQDARNRFYFASLQSDLGQNILAAYGVKSRQDFKSLVLLEGKTIYQKSTAALRIAKHLKGLWSWLYVGIIVPRFLRDAIYTLVANNRYRWFGKRETCRLPSPEERSKFL